MKAFALSLCMSLAMPALSWADSGSMSKSCSGKVRVCENPTKLQNCSNQYFYIYAYQYAYVYNESLESESHSFSLSGALSQSGDPQLLGLSGHWIIYDGEEFLLAIPYQSDKKIYVQQKGLLLGPENASAWQALCS